MKELIEKNWWRIEKIFKDRVVHVNMIGEDSVTFTGSPEEILLELKETLFNIKDPSKCSGCNAPIGSPTCACSGSGIDMTFKTHEI